MTDRIASLPRAVLDAILSADPAELYRRAADALEARRRPGRPVIWTPERIETLRRDVDWIRIDRISAGQEPGRWTDRAICRYLARHLPEYAPFDPEHIARIYQRKTT